MAVTGTYRLENYYFLCTNQKGVTVRKKSLLNGITKFNKEVNL
jgi:hypothetical protein